MICRRLTLPLLTVALFLGTCLGTPLPGFGLAQDEEPSPPTDQIKVGKKSKKKSTKALLAALPEEYRFWLDSVDMIMSKDEKESFLELQKDYQRDAFIERFWRARDPYPTTQTNEFRQRYEEAVKVVMERFGSFEEDRARVYLVNEPPDVMMPVDCVEMWPAEVWYWQKNKKMGQRVGILFYQSGGGGKYRVWYPDDGIDALAKFPGANAAGDVIGSCNMQAQEALGVIIALVRNMGTMGFMSLLADLQEIPSIPRGECLGTLERSYGT